MAAFNVSLDDSSPLISYSPSGAWADTPVNDTLALSYSASSLHTASLDGATATINFNGTGIWFYGGHRSNYGNYTLSVDGQPIASGSAASSKPAFGQLLGGSSGLSMGQHTAVLKNAGTGPIDLDSLIFETQIGSASNGSVSMATVDDGDSNVRYLPKPSDWSVSNNSMFSHGGVHFTQTGGAQVSLSFSGDAIAIYGGVSFDHGNYTVSLNGQSQQFGGGAGGHARTYHPQTLLYFANNLGSEQHSLVMTSEAAQSGQQNTSLFLDVDSFTIYTGGAGASNSNHSGQDSSDNGGGAMSLGNGLPNSHVNVASNGTHASDNNGASAASSSHLSTPVLIGIIAASIIGFLSLLVLVIFVVQRYRHRPSQNSHVQIPSPVFPIQTPDLEAGDVYFNEKPKADLSRRNTGHTVQSRWSQSSFDSGSTTSTLFVPPPVPTLPAIPAMALKPTQPLRLITKRESVASDSSGASDFLNYYHQPVPQPGAGPAPMRPARPPGLELRKSMLDGL